MSADVNDQGAALDETFFTAGNRARIRTLVGVDSVMALKVRIALEALLREESVIRSLSPSGVNEELALLHESQSHWKGRVLGSYSTSSRSSIMDDAD